MAALKQFSVIVTRDTTESITLKVMAEDDDEAQQIALAESYKLGHAWEQDCTPNASADHYTNGAEEIDG